MSAPPLFQPLSPSKSLTAELVKRLTAEITSGALAPGARLPTEQQLVEALGVSRTVVREAVSALKADGLVITRQGVGAFVAQDTQRRPFRIDPDDLTLAKVLDVMELRTGVEVEAAGLAAERRTGRHVKQMEQALDAIDVALARGEAAVGADFDFHCAIADATRNGFFRDFLQYLGRFIIPRQSLRSTVGDAAAQAAYLQQVQAEHRVIFQAIAGSDVEAARAAVRSHLTRSRERYRGLVEPAGRKRKK